MVYPDIFKCIRFIRKNVILVFTDLFKIFHSKTNPVAGLG